MLNNEISSFLLKHKFDVNLSVNTLAQQILYDMNLGLLGSKNGDKAGQDMFKTWILPPEKTPENKSVIVIDAGGTNFRSCLVTFGADGELSVSDFKKTCMPGVEKELSKKEFFAQIADNIDYLKNKADRIGFCFSYAMSITKDGDGIPNAFSKEVKAPEVIGCPVGKTLVEELESRGWNKIQHIALLNDTVAALLAGRVSGKPGTDFSSYIGFILGTGINGAYIQPAATDSEGTKIEPQIIVTESGKCNKIFLSDFDLAMDAKTAVPGQYPLEKQCSGGYLGSVGLEILLQAAREKMFSDSACEKILKIEKLTLIQIDEFLYGPYKSSVLAALCSDDSDREKIYLLMDALVDRCAKNAAAILVAEAVQSGEGKNPVHPIGILCNGTTFYKTHKLYGRIIANLDEYLTRQRGIFYEILTVENDITLGTAVAGLL
ncbi:MAG: hexokinase [Treponema sp.]|nr:hexokinase [Candidatus Treponema equifaecale]